MRSISDYLGHHEPPSFDEWWAVYPRKQSKKKAQVIYDNLSDVEKGACYLGTLQHVEENIQWSEDQFIPMPTTFLNQARWEDDIPQTRQQKVASAPVTNEAELVWTAMEQFFGDLWVKRYGPKPTEIWRKMLKGVSEPRLKRGLRCTFESGSEFPPSLPKFMEYCRPTFGELHPPRPALPRPEGSEAVALDALKQMKSILRGNNDEH